jgi:YHS domain-containing protein
MKSSVLMPMFLLATLGLTSLVSCTASTSKTASSDQPSPTATTTDATSNPPTATTPAKLAIFVEEGVAIRGADPVAYFTQSQYVPGSAQFTYEWMGATWQFSSAEHRDLFATNPEQYVPQYGGFCAWAVSQGKTAPVDPTSWKIVDGKLYLNFNKSIQERWEKDIPGNIDKANQNWPAVLDKS